jgi:25S rRNA (uracil2634-N3)-methyltransferase
MGKLKSALGAHQHYAKQASVAKAKEAAKNSKVIKSAAEKRTIKRQRREKEEKERERLEAGRQATAKAKGKGRLEAEEDVEMGDEDENEDEDETERTDTADAKQDAKRAAAAAAAASRAVIPLEHDDTILLLGEANFSFAVSLLTRGHSGHLLCATAFDSEAECVDKYPDAAEHIERLRDAGARVAFNVDGGALEKPATAKAVGKGPRWSRVVFNFPHVGKGIQDQDRNVRSNQEMLLRTMRSVAPLLTVGPSAFPLVEVKVKGKKKAIKMPKPKAKALFKRADSPDVSEDEAGAEAAFDDDDDPFPKPSRPVPASFSPPNKEGSLLITLLDQNPYALWGAKALATHPPVLCPGTKLAQPTYRLLRSFEFVPQAYPGYAHRRTIGWREGKSFSNNEEILGRKGRARTWEFALKEEEEDDYESRVSERVATGFRQKLRNRKEQVTGSNMTPLLNPR